MSAVHLILQSGSSYYTQDYETPEEVKAAVGRDEELTVFWFAPYGRRFQETLLLGSDDVLHYITEREIP